MAEPKSLFDSQDCTGAACTAIRRSSSAPIKRQAECGVAIGRPAYSFQKNEQDSVSPDRRVSEAPLPCKRVVLRGRLLAFVGKQLDDC